MRLRRGKEKGKKGDGCAFESGRGRDEATCIQALIKDQILLSCGWQFVTSVFSDINTNLFIRHTTTYA